MGCIFDDLMAASAGQLVTTPPFTANGTWTAPAGVTRVETVSGRGGNGAAEIPPAYTAATAVAASANITNPTATALANSGQTTWNTWINEGISVRDYINAQAVSNQGAIIHNSYTVNVNITGGGVHTYNEFNSNESTFARVLAGSATLRTVGISGGSSSPITSGSTESGYRYVDYDYVTPGTGIAATTGASATALGFSFPGGLGGAGTITDQGPATVVPGNVYTIVVPSGGSVTISYYQ